MSDKTRHGLKGGEFIFLSEWFDNVGKLNDKPLLDKESFYPKLKESHITDSDYKQDIDECITRVYW